VEEYITATRSGLPAALSTRMNEGDRMAWWLFWRCYDTSIDTDRFRVLFGRSMPAAVHDSLPERAARVGSGAAGRAGVPADRTEARTCSTSSRRNTPTHTWRDCGRPAAERRGHNKSDCREKPQRSNATSPGIIYSGGPLPCQGQRYG
jgi:hypothetical protein